MKTCIGGFGISSFSPDKIVKELSLTLPTSDLLSDTVKNTNISNLIGEFFHDNKILKRNTISSIINELLTNGIKYSQKNTDIKLSTYSEEHVLYISMENYCTKTQMNYLNRYLKRIANSNKDILELYIDRNLCLSKNKKIKRAQLGLISLINNFNCLLDINTKQVDNSCAVFTKVIFQGVTNV